MFPCLIWKLKSPSGTSFGLYYAFEELVLFRWLKQSIAERIFSPAASTDKMKTWIPMLQRNGQFLCFRTREWFCCRTFWLWNKENWCAESLFALLESYIFSLLESYIFALLESYIFALLESCIFALLESYIFALLRISICFTASLFALLNPYLFYHKKGFDRYHNTAQKYKKACSNNLAVKCNVPVCFSKKI